MPYPPEKRYKQNRVQVVKPVEGKDTPSEDFEKKREILF